MLAHGYIVENIKRELSQVFPMNDVDVLCAGIIVADHVCTPISHVPAAGELVMAEGMLLTIGGCAANAAVDLAKMEVQCAVVGRVGGVAMLLLLGDEGPLLIELDLTREGGKAPPTRRAGRGRARRPDG